MPTKLNYLALGISETDAVNIYMQNSTHPLIDVAEYIRQIILETDKNIGEGIYWNAPTFYYTGDLPAFNPKEYKRYIIGFVFNKKDCVRMVILRGANLIDPKKLLEGDYKDGRRLITFTSTTDVKTKQKVFVAIIKQIIKNIKQVK
jgi:hypothetical protein